MSCCFVTWQGRNLQVDAVIECCSLTLTVLCRLTKWFSCVGIIDYLFDSVVGNSPSTTFPNINHSYERISRTVERLNLLFLQHWKPTISLTHQCTSNSISMSTKYRLSLDCCRSVPHRSTPHCTVPFRSVPYFTVEPYCHPFYGSIGYTSCVCFS